MAEAKKPLKPFTPAMTQRATEMMEQTRATAPSGPFNDEMKSFNAGEGTANRTLECPLSVMADSYKGTHLKMYPDNTTQMRVYGAFRQRYPGMAKDDERIVVYGIKHYINQFISRYITSADVVAGQKFIKLHLPDVDLQLPVGSNTPGTDYFDLLGEKHHFPVKIEALPEGSVTRPGIPAYIITAKDEYSRLGAFLETILTMIWYPSAVATLSRHSKTLIEAAFEMSVDDGKNNPLIESRLHDFGFRGCTCVEQSVIGGAAHLLNFDGSDTMSACYHATYHLNRGRPVGKSLPATEHSVMTSWSDEITAITNLCTRFPGNIVACVMDSYDYDNALNFILPAVRDVIITTGCKFVIRPDSGNAVDQVLKGLRAAARVFGFEYNSKGFMVINNVSVIQGDGIEYSTISNILKAVQNENFSAQNVAFGMGGGLLQKVNRDTMSFATKLSYIETGGTHLDSMKCPSGDINKWSLPGKIMVLQQIITPENGANPAILGPHVVYDEADALLLIKNETHKNSMIVVYDETGDKTETTQDQIKSFYEETFDDVKARLKTEWDIHDPANGLPPAIDAKLKDKQLATKKRHTERIKSVKETAILEANKKEIPLVDCNIPFPLIHGNKFFESNFTTAHQRILNVLNKAL